MDDFDNQMRDGLNDFTNAMNTQVPDDQVVSRKDIVINNLKASFAT